MNERQRVDEFLTPDELVRVREAVQRAEQRTSGEIRVHLDKAIEEEVMDHAAFVFKELEMHRTQERNGILIYVSVPSRRIAVIGDKGIHERLGNEYWKEVLELILGHFRLGQHCEGLCAGVERLGEQLRTQFPYQSDDVNELSDDVSFGG